MSNVVRAPALGLNGLQNNLAERPAKHLGRLRSATLKERLKLGNTLADPLLRRKTERGTIVSA